MRIPWGLGLGGLGRFGGNGGASFGTPAFGAVIMLTIAAGAQRRIEARWEQLAEQYQDDLETLEVTFGRFLQAHYPRVRSAHSRGRLAFGQGDGAQLSLVLAEPVRSQHGWGGAELAAHNAAGPVALPAPRLFLTFATRQGRGAQWVAHAGPHQGRRVALVTEAFVADAAARTFGPTGQSRPEP